MSAVDFGEWATPPLVLTLGGRTFVVQPPSVDESKQCIAATVYAEIKIGIAKGTMPDDLQKVLDTIGEDDHPGLRTAYQEMKDAGVDPDTIARMGTYAIFYWARGKQYADGLAVLLWMQRDLGVPTAADASRKASSRPKTSRRTASGSRTKKAGTTTTGRSRKR